LDLQPGRAADQPWLICFETRRIEGDWNRKWKPYVFRTFSPFVKITGSMTEIYESLFSRTSNLSAMLGGLRSAGMCTF